MGVFHNILVGGRRGGGVGAPSLPVVCGGRSVSPVQVAPPPPGGEELGGPGG